MTFEASVIHKTDSFKFEPKSRKKSKAGSLQIPHQAMEFCFNSLINVALRGFLCSYASEML